MGNKKTKFKFTNYTFLIIFLFWSLSTIAQEYSLEVKFEVPVSMLKSAAENNASYKPFLPYIKNGIKVFKLTYKTTYKGKVLNASGIIIVPIGLDQPLR